MRQRIFHVDAFTERPFGGNPAAICVLNEARDESWMQSIAREMNVSETAFLLAHGEGYSLRWFTPCEEIDLCGHATLAGAHILWEEGFLGSQKEATFYTRSGLLKAKRQGNWIELDFPSTPEQRTSASDILKKSLGIPMLYVGESKFDLLVEVDNEQIVRSLKPDFGMLRKIKTRGVIVTSKASSREFDFVSRFFAPSIGIDEDPVTGSAHCCLGPFWSKKMGKRELTAFQASKRGGIIRVRVSCERVFLSGQAITISCGQLSDYL